MPSPNSITELIIFVVVASIVVVGFMVGSRYTRWGKRLSGDWRPGPIDITPRQPDPSQPRQKYVDPLGKIKPYYVLGPAVILLIIAFVYYFVTKQTFQAGN